MPLSMDITISSKESWVILDVMDEPIQLLHSLLTYFSRKPSSGSLAIDEIEETHNLGFFVVVLTEEAAMLTLG